MKKKFLTALLATTLTVSVISGCGSTKTADSSSSATKAASSADAQNTSSSGSEDTSDADEATSDSDQEAADKVAALIDAIYVQERTDKTDKQCKAAKEAWGNLTDAQKELVEGENGPTKTL